MGVYINLIQPQIEKYRMVVRKLTGPEKKRIAAVNEWKCYMCDTLLPSTYEIDHVIPLFEGGEDTAFNCKPACPGCHRKKSEEETIRRHTRPVQRYMVCNVCDMKVSPYFNHQCPIRPNFVTD